MARLRYKGDVTKTLPKVLGGRFVVIKSTYDEDSDQTTVEVAPLRNPAEVAGL